MIGVNTELSVLQTHNRAISDRTMHCGGAVVSPDTHAHTVSGVLLRDKDWLLVSVHARVPFNHTQAISRQETESVVRCSSFVIHNWPQNVSHTNQRALNLKKMNVFV